MTMQAPRADSMTLDDSWFDRPGRPFTREELPRTDAPPAEPQRDDSVELDDPWFREDSWR